MGGTKMETDESYALSGESHPVLRGTPLSSGGTSLRNEGRNLRWWPARFLNLWRTAAAELRGRGLLCVAAGTLGVFPCYYSLTQEVTVSHMGRLTALLWFIGWIASPRTSKQSGCFRRAQAPIGRIGRSAYRLGTTSLE